MVSKKLQKNKTTKNFGRNGKRLIFTFVLVGLILYLGIYYLINLKNESNSYSSNYKTPEITLVPKREPEPTVDSINGWERYLNQGFGFSFQYPSGWEFTNNIILKTEFKPYDKDVTSGFKKTLAGNETKIDDFTFGYIITKQKPDDLIAMVKKNHPEALQTNIIIDNTPATKLTYGPNNMGITVIINSISKRFFPGEVLIFDGIDANQIVTKALSTFKFDINRLN